MEYGTFLLLHCRFHGCGGTTSCSRKRCRQAYAWQCRSSSSSFWGVVATAFLKYWRPPARKAPVTYPYARCAALFSQTEQRLLWALREAVPQLQVFGKVRMEDVIVVRRDLPKSGMSAPATASSPAI